jgi:bacillopeptidase F (M6 metalloprotease family)
VDLSAYEGSTIRIAFYMTSTWNGNDNGWYVDDVSVIKGPASFSSPEDFESGPANWSADNGVWEVGMPTTGPETCHSLTQCAGTILDGNYPDDANTRLISPYITIPNLDVNERVRLRFWHWFRLEDGLDYGSVQVSVDGGAWQTLLGGISGISPVWTQVYVDLSAYEGSTIQIAFYMTSTWNGNDNGWYVDDVSVIKGPAAFSSPEDFENGPANWSADNGVWEVGVPTAGPETCHSLTQCAGTILDGNYPDDANTRLISPYIMVTSEPGQVPGVYFWHWFRLQDGLDYGWVQVSVDGGAWQTVLGPFSGAGAQWTQAFLNLSNYEGTTIRIGFFMTSTWNGNDKGWYVDDIRSEGLFCPDSDEDGYPADYCGGGDCDDLNPAVNPDATENCSNLIDDDCDEAIDCADPDCSLDYACSSNAEAATYGSNSLSGSGISNELILLLIPIGAVIFLRTMRRKR